MRQRLDQYMFEKGLVQSRSQAANLIKLGKVKVGGRLATKPHQNVFPNAVIEFDEDKYVSRAGNKLASVADKLNLDFKGKVVLDIGSSTGGFTQYAIKKRAKKVIAVDVGTDQLHRILLGHKKIELHEKTDIREFDGDLSEVDIVLADVSFISLREILPSVINKLPKTAELAVMVKPQFEAGEKQKNKGVVKNNKFRREILKDFELWTRQHFIILDKADSEVSGTKGNLERFYSLRLIK